MWLNTYLVGRLRALPPENDSHPAVPGIESPGSVAMQGPNGVTSQQEVAVAPLPDRIDALNSSLDPWERTGAAPQGWAAHLHQAMVPIQGYIQLRPQTEGTLPAFGFAGQSPSGDKAVSDSGGQPAPRRIGMSIFSRDPICKTLAVTADVDHVMSEWSMMTTPVTVVSSVFYIQRSAWCPMEAPAHARV